jgi:hypothetical protein
MKKYLEFRFFLGVISFLFLAGSLSAQSTFYKKYQHEVKQWGNCVIETSDGGYAVVGVTTSTDYVYQADVWLLKTDSSGDTLWTKTFGASDQDEGFCLIETSDHGFIIAATKAIPQHYNDGWVFKTDANGNMEWEHLFGTGLNGESASSIVPAGENTFLISGNLESKSYVFKIDIEGNILWEQSYFPNQNSSTTSICRLNNNTFAVVGSFQMYSGGGWYPNLFTIDSTGNLGYQLTYSLLGEGGFNFIINTIDGGMIFGGAENGENVVYKNSLTGVEEWSYRYYQEEWNQGVRSAVQTSDNNIVITDNTFYASMRKLNITSGDTLWTRTSSFNDEYPIYTNLTTTSDNGIIITGYNGDNDLVLVKTMENGSVSGVENHNSIQKSITLNQNFPNPFNERTELSFHLSKYESVELYITDMNSKRIRTIIKKSLAPGEYKFIWEGDSVNGMDCPSGIYYAVLRTNNGITKTRKMIKILK